MAPKMDIHFRQEDYLYDMNWDAKIDGCFIDQLSMDARIGDFVWPKKTMTTLIAARDIIRMQFGHDFSYVYINKKLDSLEERYSTFKWMLGEEGVHYDTNTNKMSFEKNVFRELAKQNYYVGAYKHEGEPRFEDLSEIFAEEPVNVLTISSDEEEKKNETKQAAADGERTLGISGKRLGKTGPDQFQYGPFEPFKEVGGPSNLARKFTPSQMVPLDQVHVSGGNSKTPSFNIWDYLNYFSDDDSTGTDVSTANSFNCGAAGIRSGLDCKGKQSGTKGSRLRVSATDSCSPHGKSVGKKTF